MKKGIQRYADKQLSDPDPEEILGEQLSAFGISPAEIKQTILAVDLPVEPPAWDEQDRETLAREIRTRTKPIVIAANKMDLPEAQENWEEITDDPDYEHLSFVSVSAHAEKALKNGAEQGVLEYVPGESEFEIATDLPRKKKTGLGQIREFAGAFGGTGVQQALEAAVFDVLELKALSPGSVRQVDQRPPP